MPLPLAAPTGAYQSIREVARAVPDARNLLPSRKPMRVLSRLAAAAFVLAIPVFLVTSNVRFVGGDVSFYEQGFRNYHASETTGVALPELDRAAGEIVDYFENSTPTLRIIVTQDGQETSLFSAKETAHMEDVKSLMRFVFRVNEVSLVIILAYICAVVLWAREVSLRGLAKLAILGVGIGFAAVAAVGGIAAVGGFNSTWSRFHTLVFSNDLWKLNPETDHLIQMFPERFWEEMTYLVGILTVVEALAIVGASLAYLLFSRSATQHFSDPGLPQRPLTAEKPTG